MRFVRGIVAFGLVVFVAGAALAATQSDRVDCEKESGDKAIAACTRVIQDRSESERARAAAYSNRGAEYRTKGDNDRAIADYDEAIKLDPKNAIAYFNRGAAYQAKGDQDRAIADYKEALGFGYEKAREQLLTLGVTP